MKDNKWAKGRLPSITPIHVAIDLAALASLGSCFSRNIYRWLQHHNVVNSPNIWGLFYNPFAILAEVKRIFEKTEWRENVIIEKNSSGPTLYIDPWRTWIKAETFSELEFLNEAHDKKAMDVLGNCKTLIITYGLSEAWKHSASSNVYLNEIPLSLIAANKKESNYICEIPSQEIINKAIGETLLILNKYRADINVILTLSPVPMKHTFSGLSIREANNISKAMLLLGIRQACSDFENAIYYPSYEIVQAYSEADFHSVWQADSRHITAYAIDKIGDMFCKFCNYTITKVNSNFTVPLLNSIGQIIGNLSVDGTKNVSNE